MIPITFVLKYSFFVQNIEKELYQFLIDNGFPLDIRDKKGRSVLHFNAMKNNSDIFMLLNSLGLDIHSKTEYQWTPLHYACFYESYDIVKFYLDNGYEDDFYMEDAEGYTPLSYMTDDSTKDYIKTNYPQINWKIYNDQYTSIENFCKLFASLKYLFSPTGSAFIGMLFMKKDSIIVSAEAECRDLVFKGISLTFGIFYLTFSSPNCSHFSNENMKINKEDLKRITHVSFYVLENKMWPVTNWLKI